MLTMVQSLCGFQVFTSSSLKELRVWKYCQDSNGQRLFSFVYLVHLRILVKHHARPHAVMRALSPQISALVESQME